MLKVTSLILQLWRNAERLMAIDRLIETCEPMQVRHMLEVIEPQFQRDFISLLPKEASISCANSLHAVINFNASFIERVLS